MQSILNFFTAAVAAIFIENTIFTRALGTSRMLSVANSPKIMLKFCIILTSVTTVSGFISWQINYLFSEFEYKQYAEPLVYVTILTLVYVISNIAVYVISPKLHKKIKNIMPLAIFNCATLGALLLPAHNNMFVAESSLTSWVGFSFGTGIAFFLASILVSEGIRKLEASNVPKAFKGLPASLIYIGILSLAFYGLIGHELPF